MQDCDTTLLSAYLDDELDQPSRANLAEHLRRCPVCSEELELLREASRAVAMMDNADLTQMELARLHRVIDKAAGDGTRRLMVLTAAIAASILAISATWLATLTERSPAMPVQTASIEPWEQVATSLRVEALPTNGDQDDEPVRLADARFADWMIDGLNRNQP